MYTRCPKCSTCFRVTDRHLAIAKGKVRCGQCQLVFNAPDNAIDDLPATKSSPAASFKPTPPKAPKAEINKTIHPNQDSKKVKSTAVKAPDPVIRKPAVKTPDLNTKPATAEKKLEKIAKPTEEIKAKEVAIEKPAVQAPQFNAEKTMIAETGVLTKKKLKESQHDTSSKHLHSFDDNDDDSFDDSFDLNAAIDELDQAAEKEAHNIVIEKEPISTEPEIDIQEKESSGDVFTTDAYDATNASSVADILSEMEGQLSLDIDEPEKNDNYDANDEFEFIQLDDEISEESHIEAKEETNEETLKNHFDLDDDLDELFDESDDLEDAHSQNEPSVEEPIDADALFDHLDISDFEESGVEEDIILEEPPSINIGQHNPDDENDIPLQLRNDIERLKAPASRQLHPLLKVTFIIILFALSFSQLAYFRAHELVNLAPSTQPLLEQFCETIGCHYSGPSDSKKIQLISRDVRLHPKTKKALLISAAMINNASFAQPYPDIHIRLSDISGNVVAERIFNSKTYMGKLSNPFLLMKSKTPVHINFEVVDPGKDAINFEFTFL